MDAVSFNLHQFGDHILLEVITDAGNGNVTVLSIEFEIEDVDRGLVTPISEIPNEYDEDIRNRLESSGFLLPERQVA